MKKCDTEHTQSSHFLQETWKEVNEFSFGPIYIGCEKVGYVFLSFLFLHFLLFGTKFRPIPASSVLKDFHVPFKLHQRRSLCLLVAC